MELDVLYCFISDMQKNFTPWRRETSNIQLTNLDYSHSC